MEVKILIITTGGTIDKVYDPITGEFNFQTCRIKSLLKQGRTELNLDWNHLMQVDSLMMTREQRQQILKACKEADSDHILITHGTDTMTDTAKVISNANLNKIIVITGAMIPASVENSDAIFNIGSALATLPLLKPGVYIAFHGKIFDAAQVKKDTHIGFFRTI